MRLREAVRRSRMEPREQRAENRYDNSMERTYRYLSFGYILGSLFLSVFSIMWMYLSFTQPLVERHVNGVPIYAPWTSHLIGLIGIPIFLLAIRLVGMTAFEKIVVSNGEVVWTDWKGIERLRSPLSHIIRVSTPSAKPASPNYTVMITVETVEGSFKFMSSLNGYIDLLDTLQDAAQKNNLDTLEKQPAVLREQRMVYKYRGSGIYFYCGFMFAWSIFWTVGYFNSTMPFGIWVLAFPILLFAVWMLLIILKERVTLEGGDLTYTDCFGQTRLKCPLSEVRSVSSTQSMWGSGGGRSGSTRTITIYKVHTLRGDFRFSEFLDNAADLRDRLIALAKTTQPTKAELVPKVYSGWNASNVGGVAVGLFLIVVGVYLLLSDLIPVQMRPMTGGLEIIFGLAFSTYSFWSSNRQIELTNDEIIARDGFGRETLRSPLSQITLVDDAQIITQNGRVDIPRSFQDRGEIARVLEAYAKPETELTFSRQPLPPKTR